MKPFERLPFSELREKPRLPHGFAETPAHEVVVESEHFGTTRVHYREIGSGPPLLLVHGLMTSSYSWRYVFAPLSQNYRVIAPDLPGAGRSDKPDVCYSAPALARFLIELTDALGIRGTRVIANSLGGYLAMRAALLDAGVFCQLVNEHSPGIPEPRLRALSLSLALPGARSALAAFVRRDVERWAHRNVHYFDETLKSREEAREYGAPLASTEGSRAFVRWLGDALRPSDLHEFSAELARRRDQGEGFPIPLMLLYARQDPMVPPRVGEELSRLVPDARFVWLDDTSHFMHIDSPERVLEMVAPFLLSSPRM
jgi:pimeloyl-ACP methyl ester carboxylesterase